MTTVKILTKADCHLCDVAREIVDTVVTDLDTEQIEVIELSILDDPALYELWWDKIPVVLIDDTLHAHWRVSPDRLRTALAESLEENA